MLSPFISGSRKFFFIAHRGGKVKIAVITSLFAKGDVNIDACHETANFGFWPEKRGWNLGCMTDWHLAESICLCLKNDLFFADKNLNPVATGILFFAICQYFGIIKFLFCLKPKAPKRIAILSFPNN